MYSSHCMLPCKIGEKISAKQLEERSMLILRPSRVPPTEQPRFTFCPFEHL
jgi:hypothetical protein